MDRVFLLVAYDLEKSDEDAQSRINDFVALSQKAGVEFIGLTSSAPATVDAFKKKHHSAFEYYFTDGTTLKTMIRSNPGLLLLKRVQLRPCGITTICRHSTRSIRCICQNNSGSHVQLSSLNDLLK